MKNIIKLLGIALAAVIGFEMVSCGDADIPPESMTPAQRWISWYDKSSTVTIEHSVDNDDVCTITVGGTPLTAQPAFDYFWKATAEYAYTVTAGKTYTYTFEAWTDGDDRGLGVGWYEDNDAKTYQGTGFSEVNPGNWIPNFTITSERKTYTIQGNDPIPKSGKQSVRFQCANQTGTFHVKIISIKEAEVQKITITGITGKTGNAMIFVEDDTGLVAGADGSISGNSVTFNLKTAVFVEEGFYWGSPWTGNGPYYLTLWFEESKGSGTYADAYDYTNGQTEPQKYTISSPASTIPFSKFGHLEGGGSSQIPEKEAPSPNGQYSHSTGNYVINCDPSGQNAGVFTLYDNIRGEELIQGTYTYNRDNMKISFVSNEGSFTFIAAALSANASSFTVSGITGEKEYLNGTWTR